MGGRKHARAPAVVVHVTRFNGNSPFEDQVGYCRALAAGPFVFVSGTTATRDDGTFESGDAGAQTRQAVHNVRLALERAGSGLDRVLQLTIHVTDAEDFLPLVAPVLREAFGEHPPTMTMVEVAGLVDPAMRVELTAIALSGDA